MRLLIDGYNLMHAAGLLPGKIGPEGLRRTRHRFLNDLAARLGPERAAETTVVFDASSLPVSQRPIMPHKGMTVIYAIEDEDADSRIEHLIAAHSAPRSLTVVSSDRRLRRAAARRRAAAVTADAFLDQLDADRRKRLAPPPSPSCEERGRTDGPCPREVDRWIGEFAGLAEDPDLLDVPDPISAAWTDAELEEVAAEVAAEPAFDAPLDLPPPDWTDAEMERIAREVEAEADAHRGRSPGRRP